MYLRLESTLLWQRQLSNSVVNHISFRSCFLQFHFLPSIVFPPISFERCSSLPHLPKPTAWSLHFSGPSFLSAGQVVYILFCPSPLLPLQVGIFPSMPEKASVKATCVVLTEKKNKWNHTGPILPQPESKQDTLIIWRVSLLAASFYSVLLSWCDS